MRGVEGLRAHVHHAVARVAQIGLPVQVAHHEGVQRGIVRQRQRLLVEIDAAPIGEEIIAGPHVAIPARRHAPERGGVRLGHLQAPIERARAVGGQVAVQQRPIGPGAGRQGHVGIQVGLRLGPRAGPVQDLLPELVQRLQLPVEPAVHRTEVRGRAVAEVVVAQVARRCRPQVRQDQIAAVNVALVPAGLPAVEGAGVEGLEARRVRRVDAVVAVAGHGGIDGILVALVDAIAIGLPMVDGGEVLVIARHQPEQQEHGQDRDDQHDRDDDPFSSFAWRGGPAGAVARPGRPWVGGKGF